MRAIVGALRVVLGMDSAGFEQGANQVEKRTVALRKSMKGMGDRMSRMGRQMSVGVTAPLAGLAVAMKSAMASAETLGDAAKATNASVAGLQALRFAADQNGSSAGEMDAALVKLTRRMSMFAKDGGGPAADAIRTLGLNVRNADGTLRKSDAVFRDIAGALQEVEDPAARVALASGLLGDRMGPMLVPLLAQGRAGVEEWTARAEELGMILADDVVDGAAAANADLRALGNGLKTQLQAALLNLMPVFTDLARALVPMVQGVVGGITRMSERFKALSPQAQRFAALAVGLAAGLGPLAVVLGTVAIALSAIASPILLVAGAVVALGAAAVYIYQNWDGIAAWFGEQWQAAKDRIVEKAGEIKAWLQEKFSWRSVVGGWTGLQFWALGRMQMLRQSFADGWQAVKDEIAGWAGDLRQAGLDIMQGLLNGLNERWERVTGFFSGLGASMSAKFKEAMGIQSPSKVFRGFGQNIGEGLALGLEDSSDAAAASLQGIIDKMGMDGLQGQLDDVSAAMKDTGTAGQRAFDGIGRSIGGAIRQGEGLRGVLGAAASSWAGMLSQQAQTGIRDAMPDRPGLGGFLSSLAGGLMGFRDGGAFEVGGMGGIDSQLVAFRASPDERVTVTRPDQDTGGGGLAQIFVHLSDDLNARIERVAGPVAVQVTQAGFDRYRREQDRA